MATTKEPPQIYAKMAAVMAAVGAISKQRKNTQQGYAFRGIDDALNALHGPLSEAGVFYTAAVRDLSQREYVTKSGTAMLHILLTVAYTFYAEDGSSVTFEAVGEASDSGDKAAGKAQAYALKLALLQIFCIPTEEQKDTEYQHPERAAVAAPVIYPLTPESQRLIEELIRHPAITADEQGRVLTSLPDLNHETGKRTIATLQKWIAEREAVAP